MRKICRTLLLAIMPLPPAVLSQTDFEATTARAEAGYATSQYNLGVAYFNGTGIAQSDQYTPKLYLQVSLRGGVGS
jgi:TPR repeat protein